MREADGERESDELKGGEFGENGKRRRNGIIEMIRIVIEIFNSLCNNILAFV